MFTEEELLKGCLANSRIHQRAFYEKYAGKMYALCLRYARDVMEAEDFLQEGFVKVFARLDMYRSEGSLEGWVRKVIVNIVLQKLRSNKLQFVEIDAGKNYNEDGDTGVLGTLAADELLGLIKKLPLGYRTVFNLYVLEEYSHKEIAKELGITEGTSKSQLSRARAILQKMVTNNESIKDIYYAESRGTR
jgi:RNA polymerase sigma factor (sigma-70 family)